jgi:hypothetical protein
MGAALLLGAYFTYLLITNDEQIISSKEFAGIRNNTLPHLYTLTGLPGMLFNNTNQNIDSVFYAHKWNQLIAMPGYREMDSLFLDSVIRKMYFDSLTTLAIASADTIVLQNDRLVETKSISVTVQKQLLFNNDTSKIDYIYSDTKYNIEFWESPINFRGFKRTGNHVVLFGLVPKNLNGFAQIDNNLYIREKQLWYFIPNTADFSGFSPVTSLQMLSRLESAIKKK